MSNEAPAAPEATGIHPARLTRATIARYAAGSLGTGGFATLPVTGKAKGTYTYTVEFTNAAGTTVSAPLTVTVTK